MRYIGADELQELGILQEVNRRFFHPLGLALELSLPDATVRIQDHRDDPEGVIFAEDVIDSSKCDRFDAFERSRAPARITALGYVIQPSGRQ